MNKVFQYVLLGIVTLSLTACSALFQSDNTPKPKSLTPLAEAKQPELLWTSRTGKGSGDYYLRLNPAQDKYALYTVNQDKIHQAGYISAIEKATGNTLWKKKVPYTVTTGAALGEEIVVVGTQKGHVLALSKSNGEIVWDRRLPGEILATPAVGGSKVAVKTMDGQLFTLASKDGDLFWSYSLAEPNLVLRAASSPVIHQDHVITGFANGNIANLTLSDGGLLWTKQIAIPEGGFTLSRMIDVDANPIIYSNHLLTATYQGRVSSLNLTSGNIDWVQNLSSYTGMAIDRQAIYISDEKGFLWAFNANNGAVKWKQEDLSARVLSSPAISGKYIVVGDKEGYLHWLDRTTGKFSARVKTGRAPIYASILADNNKVYAYATDGTLYAYSMG